MDAESWGHKDKQIVALQHSANATLPYRTQVAWFAENTSADPVFITRFANHTGSWNDLKDKTLNWLNKHVAPHQLVDISFFEHDHPNDERMDIECFVAHTAGSKPEPLASVSGITLPEGGLYTMKTFETMKSYADCVNQAKKHMNLSGADEGFRVTISNSSWKTDLDGHVACVISWSPTKEM